LLKIKSKAKIIKFPEYNEADSKDLSFGILSRPLIVSRTRLVDYGLSLILFAVSLIRFLRQTVT
jgi:hypothetical protein